MADAHRLRFEIPISKSPVPGLGRSELRPALDPPGIAPPVFTPSPFNALVALTRFDVVVNTGGNFIIGASDLRGDGSP